MISNCFFLDNRLIYITSSINVVLQLKIRNDFDPVLSPESSLFVLKSNKKVSFNSTHTHILWQGFVQHVCWKYSNKLQVAYQDIVAILDSAKFCSSVQKFIDIYIRLPGIPSNGQLRDSDCIRVRICEGRFALLIREVGNIICLLTIA